MTENERIKMIRNHFNLTQEKFSEELGIQQGSYSDIERGKSGISTIVLRNLVVKYRINPIWLYEGTGNMLFSELEFTSFNNINTGINHGEMKVSKNAETEIGQLHKQLDFLYEQIKEKDGLINRLLIKLNL